MTVVHRCTLLVLLTAASFPSLAATDAVDPVDAGYRRASAEEAAAMAPSRPERIAALEQLVAVLDELRDTKAAAAVRSELADLRNPGRVRPGRTLAIAVVDSTVYPLTFTAGPIRKLAWNTQPEATRFLARYLYEGRVYSLAYASPGAKLTLGADPSFKVNEDGCTDGLYTKGVVSGASGSAWLAFSAPVTPPRPPEPLGEGDRAELLRLARAAFQAQAARKPVDPRLVRDASGSPSLEGFVKDLDGDGQPELVGVVGFRAPPTALESYVFLIVPRDTGATRPHHSRVALRGPGEDGSAVIRLVGAADLDSNGVDEVVIQQEGYEGSHVEILIRTTGWKFRGVVATSSGC